MLCLVSEEKYWVKKKTMFKNIILLYLVYYEKYLKIKQTKLI